MIMNNISTISGNNNISTSSKVNKVKFADEFQSASSLSFDSMINSNCSESITTTTTTTTAAANTAYTIATLRRSSTKLIHDNNNLMINKPLGIGHRNISSYPEGLRLIESSVDSGEQIPRIVAANNNTITTDEQCIDETEEDDYYQQQQQQHSEI
ncbi:hypothetical protein DERF_010474 [Dermatophagoides farinae]|uniref:Uncharacterized protein n=1 Tax=Dermatophagoides farinae TaxID=6954 RepID=A0A922L520_DERFA|nr:hypothetical protein DERF_010474 [Dermatophagoides farinae]